MIESTNAPRQDLVELVSSLDGLLRRACWKAAFTYGGELVLHFGRRLSYHNEKLAGKKRGQWRLATRSTAWTLFTPTGLISSREKDEDLVETKLRILSGRKVTHISISVPDFALNIAFGPTYLFRVTPTKQDHLAKAPLWKLLMPNNQVAVFLPRGFWTFQPSDKPAVDVQSRNGKLPSIVANGVVV